MSNAVIKGVGMHHIALLASDFDKTVKFYKETLGMAPYLSWGVGNGRAMMIDIGNGVFIEVFAGGKKDPPEGAYVHFALSTDDVDAAFKAAIDGGAAVHIEPMETVIEGREKTQPVRIAFVKGPDGEVIEFFKEL